MKKALFVIDMQTAYLRRGYSPELIGRVNARIRGAQTEGDLVVYIQNQGRAHGKPAVFELSPQLLVVSPHRFVKAKASLFSHPGVPALLQAQGIGAVEMAGIDGCGCVASSALEAAALGFAVALPLDCVGVRSPLRFSRKKSQLQAAGVRLL